MHHSMLIFSNQKHYVLFLRVRQKFHSRFYGSFYLLGREKVSTDAIMNTIMKNSDCRRPVSIEKEKRFVSLKDEMALLKVQSK